MTAPLLFVSGEYPPDIGGVGDYTRQLRAALATLGWRSAVLSRRHVRRWDARSLFRLVRAVPAHGVVHIQFQAGAFDLLGDVCLMPGLLRLARPRVRVVTTLHDVRPPYLFPKAGVLRKRAVGLLARSSHALIAADARDLRPFGGRWAVANHFQVPIGSNVACAPPPGFNRTAFRLGLGLSPDTLVLVYFGLLNASKGLDLVLETVALVARLRPDARLVLVGGETGASDPTDHLTAARLHVRLAQGPIAQRVIRTGWLEPSALSAHLLAADVALLPYLDGASARRGSLMACAAHSLPIVSTQPAAPEVADAVLATSATPQALAAAIFQITNDPLQAASLRRASQSLAARSSWPRIARAHIDIYEQVIYGTYTREP